MFRFVTYHLLYPLHTLRSLNGVGMENVTSFVPNLMVHNLHTHYFAICVFLILVKCCEHPRMHV